MSTDWETTCAAVGFTPHGSFGAMRLLMEDMEFVVIPNGLGHLEMTAERRLGNPSKRAYSIKLPLAPSAQQVSQAVAKCFELEHPDLAGKPGPSATTAR